jgi:hypothetical protein
MKRIKQINISELNKSTMDIYVKGTWTKTSINGFEFIPMIKNDAVYIETDEVIENSILSIADVPEINTPDAEENEVPDISNIIDKPKKRGRPFKK